MTVNELLGSRIAFYRRKAGLTQEQLAERTDYSVDFIGLVERGINAPTVAKLYDVANAIGVEVWELFYPVDYKPNLTKKIERKSKQPVSETQKSSK